MAIGFSVLAFGSGTLENKPVVWFPQLTGEANRDVVVRNVCDRDRRGPRRGGDRRLGSAGDWLVLGATLNRSDSEPPFTCAHFIDVRKPVGHARFRSGTTPIHGTFSSACCGTCACA